jgi:hypothetical protein
MNISICRDGIELGEWTEEEVKAFYCEGRLVDADLYWMPGMNEWLELRKLIRPAPPFPGPIAPLRSPGFSADPKIFLWKRDIHRCRPRFQVRLQLKNIQASVEYHFLSSI